MRFLFILVILPSLLQAKYLTSREFFSGAHLGMTMYDIVDRYGAYPMGHSSPAEGEQFIEYRHIPKEASNVQWRLQIYYRESDGKVVYVNYWKGYPFSAEEIRYLTELNRGIGPLITHLYQEDGEFSVTTPEQEEYERLHGR